MKEKIMNHLNDQMVKLRIQESNWVLKALKQKDIVKAMNYMDKAVAVSKKHDELNQKYNAYYRTFENQKLFGNLPIKV